MIGLLGGGIGLRWWGLLRAFRGLLVLAVLLPVFLLSACGTAGPAKDGPTGANVVAGNAEVGNVIRTEKGQYRDITPAELKAMMGQEDLFHVDVHVPNEGKLPELDARIPFDRVTQELDQFPQDKSAKIVLTCKGGGMSTKAATELADLGYTNVYNLSGGLVAWRDAGYPFTPEP
jgi:phage shock protein E